MIQFLLILIINTLVLIAWGNYLHHLDAFTTDKKNEYKLFWLIVWGGIPSIILTVLIQYRWENILYALTGLRSSTNPFIANLLIVGPVEELSKFAVFIALVGIMGSIKEPRDGILQAASVALGFALVENILYAFTGGLVVLLVRSILTIVGHMTYAIIWGFTWGAYKYTSCGENKSPDRFYIIPSILFAAMFHGLYNTLLEYGYPLFAISMDLLTVVLFFIIHHYVRDNSPYRKYSLKEYKQAIPALKMGLNKYPKSYELNKRMGIFHIYIRRYPDAEKYLKKAKKLNPKSLVARFYYGAANYLNGNTSEGLRQMNSAVTDMPVSRSRKMVAALKKIISEESRREELMNRFSMASGQFNTAASTQGLRRQKTASSNYTAAVRLKRNKPQYYNQSASVNVSNTESINSHKQNGFRQLPKDPDTNRSTWDMAFNERQGPVILTAHYPDVGNRVVNRAGQTYKEVLVEKVEEWKLIKKQ
ncbi:MAG: PrsW family glutamic-type intramembrane protease [Spirochaetia bacterium]|jgi:RsiW-degrading membrane proteinase PrsW (M82 family)|nr:PrsW family glutamic-type intramembrane protease [Spirochaetia bacterium]